MEGFNFFYKRIIDYAICEIESLKLFGSTIDNFQEDQRKKVEEELSLSLNSDEEDVEEEISLAVINMIGSDFPNLSRSMSLVRLYSIIELSHKKICVAVQLIRKLNFGIDDLKGASDLDKSVIYLKKSINVNIKIHKEWEILQGIKVIRNKIIHDDLVLRNTEKNRIRRYLKEIGKGIELEDQPGYDCQKIRFTSNDFLVPTSKLIINYFNNLMHDIEKANQV